jgi:hypothetical protein
MEGVSKTMDYNSMLMWLINQEDFTVKQPHIIVCLLQITVQTDDAFSKAMVKELQLNVCLLMVLLLSSISKTQ